MKAPTKTRTTRPAAQANSRRENAQTRTPGRRGPHMNMNDRMRISDSDRDRAAAQLRDYYAEGRLTSEELDERVTATLNARTAGDLRRVMADLPVAPAVQGGAPGAPPFAAPPWAYRRRGPRLLPVLLLILLAAVLLPGGWIFSVSIIATGMTGTPASSAIRATPVLPL